MDLALDEAQKAAAREEVPVGAVLVDEEGTVLAADGNRNIELHDPSAHAEILVLRRAADLLNNYRLSGCTMYVTLEPCVMCAGAMVHARLGRLVYGADDLKTGAIKSLYRIVEDQRLNHIIEVKSGLGAEESSRMLKDFFNRKRNR